MGILRAQQHGVCNSIAPLLHIFTQQHFDTQTIFKYQNKGIKLPQNTQKHPDNFVFCALYFRRQIKKTKKIFQNIHS